MRSTQLLTLALLATVASAETFNITLSAEATIREDGLLLPPYFTVGAIVTDGTCTVCSISQEETTVVPSGIEEIVLPIGGFPSTIAWGLGPGNSMVDFSSDFGWAIFNTSTDTLRGSIGSGAEGVDFGGPPNICPPSGIACPSGPDAYFFNGGGSFNEWGTFTVAPVPEPSSWLLLTTCVVPILIWRLMRRGTPGARPMYAIALACLNGKHGKLMARDDQ
jgi:hypothetical protein